MVSASFISVAILAIASVASAAPVSSEPSDVFPGNGHHRGFNDTMFPGNGHHYGGAGSHAHHPTGSAHGHRHSEAVPTTTQNAIQDLPTGSAFSSNTTSKPKGTAAASSNSDAKASPIASASGSSSSSSSSDSDEVLKLHNDFRAKHSAPALEWNSTLAEYAQKWSDGCVFEHSQGPYGENLAMGYSSWTDAVTAWYDENKDYDYSNPGYSSGTGHFTQVVWKSTSQLGCGVTKCSNGPLYTCSYYVPGNVVGGNNFEENVLPN